MWSHIQILGWLEASNLTELNYYLKWWCVVEQVPGMNGSFKEAVRT